jgi:predicted metalloendopeptidase
MGEPLGRAFVKVEFDENAKKQAREIIGRVEDTFENNLTPLTWMDEPTKKEALVKAKDVVNQVGYPDKWRDFEGLKIARNSNLENMWAAAIFNNQWDLGKIGKPVDREEWGMSPQTVNAYYSPENNKMVFPAGILQSPFFDPSAPMAPNYGAIGMVMGHEFTHGFDDEGRQFDEKGNLRDWWSPQVAADFSKRTQCLVDEYDKYVAIDNLHVNGKLTLGENIADQGGIKLAYDAYLKARGDETPAQVLGFNDKQQYFVGFAQSWCTKRRPELARMLVTVDPHSPAKFRVNGPLSNFAKFAEAFSCKSGTPMAPVNACTVW